MQPNGENIASRARETSQMRSDFSSIGWVTAACTPTGVFWVRREGRRADACRKKLLVSPP
jgi:hypothetical protein